MKAEITKPPTYSPVSITLTFNTQDELDAFGALFNFSPVIDGLVGVIENGEVNDDNIRRTVEQAGGSVSRLHQTLCAAIRKNI